MKLLTKALRNKIPPLYGTEDIPTEEKKIVLKFFSPWGSWSWYAVEGSPVDEDGIVCSETDKPEVDFLFFGLVDGASKEWGYFSLKELESVNGPFGLKIERDLSFEDVPVPEVA